MPTIYRLAVFVILIALAGCNSSSASEASSRKASRFIERSEKLLSRLGSKGMEQAKFFERRARLLRLADRVDLESLSPADRDRVESVRGRLSTSCTKSQPIDEGCVLGGAPLPGTKIRYFCD